MNEQERQDQPQAQPPPQRRLYRSETQRVVGGVAGGMAEHFGWDPTLVRLAWAITAVFGGAGLVLYIVMWIVTPTYSRVYGTPQPPNEPSPPPGTPSSPA